MISLGKKGETQAANYLQNHGYTVIHKNFYTRGGEIDLICTKDNCLVFVEVKTRTSLSFGKPYEAVTPLKLSHLKRSIQYFLAKNSYNNYKMRIDVISIVMNQNTKIPEIAHYKNAAI